MDVKIKTALISVSDKTGVVDFAKALSQMGVAVISTGGTARALSEAGLKVVPIEDVTGFPEMMNGRVNSDQVSKLNSILPTLIRSALPVHSLFDSLICSAITVVVRPNRSSNRPSIWRS